jgi:hypothetical protein
MTYDNACTAFLVAGMYAWVKEEAALKNLEFMSLDELMAHRDHCSAI